ncbi:MBL fold metallo-hydrolase [Candidatus Woesearchaeota archaeon]|nr:MBL fold metallo-hydrolase [Candidatus Woesearchaeota archaeon]
MADNGITLLGTGGDSIVVGRQLRASGGIVITTPDSQIHLDPGPGTLVQMAKHDFHPRETTAVILSHQHVNHATEAAALISAMTHNGIDRRGVLVTNTQEGLVPAYQRSLVEKFLILKPGNRVGINDIEIRAVRANHYDTDANGYIIQTPSYLLGYTGDTAYSDDWAKQFAECNILIINCRHPGDIKGGDHLNTTDVIRMLTLCKPQLAILTHFGAKMLDADPLAQARRIHHETKVQVVAAKDGLHVAPSHYDAQQRQKKLGNF